METWIFWYRTYSKRVNHLVLRIATSHGLIVIFVNQQKIILEEEETITKVWKIKNKLKTPRIFDKKSIYKKQIYK